jgi:hypothetical protein
VVQRTAAYVDQQDNHIAELTVGGACCQLPEFDVHHKARWQPAATPANTGRVNHCCLIADLSCNCMQVRETLDFAARCQGGGHGKQPVKLLRQQNLFILWNPSL